MSFRPKIKNKIIAVLFAILPAFAVGFLVFGADVYYDLDSNTVKMYENNEITGNHPYLAYRQAGLAKHTPSAPQSPLLRREYIKVPSREGLGCVETNQKTPQNNTEFLKRGGEQGSRTLYQKGTYHLSSVDASTGTLLSSDRRDCDYNTENNFNQNKNTSTESEDAFFGAFGIKVPTPDKYCQCSTPENLVKSVDVDNFKYRENIQNAKWTEVYKLSVGDEIAVAKHIPSASQPPLSRGESFYPALALSEASANRLQTVEPECEASADGLHSPIAAGIIEPTRDIIFEKIVSIEILPPEQVYDIEVQGTHNFVANGIVAHNTYINTSSTATLHNDTSGRTPPPAGGYARQSVAKTPECRIGSLCLRWKLYRLSNKSKIHGIYY